MKAGLCAAACALAGGAAAGQAPQYDNVTAGGALRPGVYGRIEVRRGPPPPLIRSQAVLARPALGPQALPIYLYVPPGQVRRWELHCAKWNACERPVYFVRMDNSPSRLGQWKQAQRSEPGPTGVLQALNRFVP